MEETKYRVIREGDDELMHFGIKGMKWGVRKQARENADRILKIQKDFNKQWDEKRKAPQEFDLSKTPKQEKAAERYLSREHRMERLTNSNNPLWTIRNAMGEDERINLERAELRYRNDISKMGDRDNAFTVISWADEQVIETPNGLSAIVAWDCVRNPGMTEKEIIELMQQRRAAISQAMNAYDKTPMGKIEKFINKGKQKVRRLMSKIKRLFK